MILIRLEMERRTDILQKAYVVEDRVSVISNCGVYEPKSRNSHFALSPE